MTVAPTLARAEAEVARSAAVRDLMATGATRAEAEAAVAEELARRLHAETAAVVESLGRAFGAGLAAIVETVNAAFRELGRAYARTQTGRPPWQVPAGQRRRDYRLVR